MPLDATPVNASILVLLECASTLKSESTPDALRVLHVEVHAKGLSVSEPCTAHETLEVTGCHVPLKVGVAREPAAARFYWALAVVRL
jgi:hypothetical protein